VAASQRNGGSDGMAASCLRALARKLGMAAKMAAANGSKTA